MAKTELKTIPVNDILANFSQPREQFDRTKTKELAESILSNGLINPITVRVYKNGKYMIVSGERRWQAHKIAKLKTIQAFVKEYKSEGQWMLESLIENVHREDLAPLERAKYLKKIADIEKIYHLKDGVGFQKYKKGDINISELAKRVKMNVDTVGDDLSIIRFEPMQTKGHSRTNLVRIASVKDKELQKEILDKTRGKSADETSKVVAITKKAPTEVKEALLDDKISVEQAERISKLKTPQQREKAITDHKSLAMIGRGVERNIENQMSVREQREFDNRLLQSNNWINSFRGSVTDNRSQLQKTIKILLLATKFIPVMDDKQKERLGYDLERFIETLNQAKQLSEQIQEHIERR